jgi:hypothetical protein
MFSSINDELLHTKMLLNSFNTITSNGSKYVIIFFNINILKIIYVYRVHSYLISTILNKLKTVIQYFFQTLSNHHDENL